MVPMLFTTLPSVLHQSLIIVLFLTSSRFQSEVRVVTQVVSPLCTRIHVSYVKLASSKTHFIQSASYPISPSTKLPVLSICGGSPPYLRIFSKTPSLVNQFNSLPLPSLFEVRFAQKSLDQFSSPSAPPTNRSNPPSTFNRPFCPLESTVTTRALANDPSSRQY